MAEIASIVYKPQHIDFESPDRYARLPLDSARLVEGYGIEGDRKGGNPKRNLNIMSSESLQGLREEGFKTAPGEMGEQIVLSGLDVASLQPGDRIQLGTSACVEVVNQRTGCDRFERIQGLSRDQAAGRMGVMTTVVASGNIRIGDRVVVLERTGENV